MGYSNSTTDISTLNPNDYSPQIQATGFNTTNTANLNYTGPSFLQNTESFSPSATGIFEPIHLPTIGETSGNIYNPTETTVPNLNYRDMLNTYVSGLENQYNDDGISGSIFAFQKPTYVNTFNSLVNNGWTEQQAYNYVTSSDFNSTNKYSKLAK